MSERLQKALHEVQEAQERRVEAMPSRVPQDAQRGREHSSRSSLEASPVAVGESRPEKNKFGGSLQCRVADLPTPSVRVIASLRKLRCARPTWPSEAAQDQVVTSASSIINDFAEFKSQFLL